MSYLAHDYIPSLRYGAKILPQEILGMGFNDFSNIWFVDGDNGSDSNVGNSTSTAFATIQAAVTAASAWDVIKVRPKAIGTGATDPASYTENIIIPPDKEGLMIVGETSNRTQGGLPQLKVGTTTTSALMTVRSPGCSIVNMGFNGIGGTGGGLLLDSDGSTKDAFGLGVYNCHFKNCVGTTATNAATGGAIMWGTNGSAWQVRIAGNRFYKNVGDIVLLGTSVSVPQDVVIEDNIFSGPAASVDCNLFLKGGGSGMNGVIIRNNVFTANPNIGSGTNAKFMDLTGCVGILADNLFAASTAEGGTEETFGATGDTIVPTTVFMARNYGEFSTGVGAGLISGEIFRT